MKRKKINKDNSRYVLLIFLTFFLVPLAIFSIKIFTTEKSFVTPNKVVISNQNKQYSPTLNSNKKDSNLNSTNTPIQPPAGQLLNVQTVSLSRGPSLESICQTIANGLCNIRLTQGSVVKYLNSQDTGASGLAIFNWSANEIGLSLGQWEVEAVVTQNSKIGISHKEFLEVIK